MLLPAPRDVTASTNAGTSGRLHETHDAFAHQNSAENGCIWLAMVLSVSPKTEHTPAKAMTVSPESPTEPVAEARPGCGACGRQQDHSQTNFAHNFPRSLFETTRKRCNLNAAISRFEQVARELRAKLLNIPGTTAMKSAAGAGGSGYGAHGRRQGLAGQRADAQHHQYTRCRRCGGRRRVRRARVGFEARRRTK